MKLTRTQSLKPSPRFSDELKKYIKENSYPSGPIQMVADTFKGGTQCIGLSDPHPLCNTLEYSLFLLKLVKHLHKTVGLKELMVESTDRCIKEDLPKQMKTYTESGIDDFQKFWDKVEKEALGIDEGKAAQIELFGVTEDWDTKEKDPDEVEIERFINERKCLNHWFLALNYATKNGITITGIDPRDTKEQEDELMNNFWKELTRSAKAKRKPNIENVLSGTTCDTTSITGSDVDFAMFEKAMERLSTLRQNENALLIAGGAHLFNASRLKRLGFFLKEFSNLNISTILSEVGLNDKEKKEVKKLKLDFSDFMDEVDIPYAALNSTTENEEIAKLVVHRIEEAATLGDFSKTQMGKRPDRMEPKYPIYVGDFDKLIYLASKQDISDLLQTVKD